MSDDRRLSKKEMMRRRRRRSVIIKSIILVLLIAVLVVLLLRITGVLGKNDSSGSKNQPSATTSSETTSGSSTDTSSSQGADISAIVAQAQALTVQYDYDGAIELIKSTDGYDQNADLISLLAECEAQKSNLVATAPTEVTHVFFHSLVVDPDRGFSLTGDSAWDTATAGFCQWMTTVDEFNAMMQQMYDRGYVLVSLYDLVEETTDESGVVHMSAKNVYLPEGKIPFVLSLDDLSYYHSYDGRGCATKMIIGDDGTPTCEYVDAQGNTLVGSYDCVPLLDDFLEEHPDFSYKGAKGTIALTGYNGILGYRTDYCYRDRVELTADQEAWLNVHPDFDWNAECEAAKAVAQCIKDDGWTFASHTWGHIRVGANKSLPDLQTDTEKWKTYVESLIGPTDIIIFAHGEDLASWNEDYATSEKFQYLKSVGFNIYCNVDSSVYFVQLEDGFLRMGRRNLDGYRLYEAVYGGQDKLSDLFDAATVIDPKRPTDASLYQL